MGLTQIEMQVFHAQIAQAKAIEVIALAFNDLAIAMTRMADEMHEANMKVEDHR